MNARLCREAEQVRRAEYAEVHRIDVGLESAAQQSCQCRLVANVIDAIQHRLDGRDTFGFDGGLVEPCRAEIGHLAGGGSHRCGGRVVQQFQDLLPGQLGNLGTGGPTFPAGRHFSGLEPATIGVGKKVVPRLDARVHAGFDCRRSLIRRILQLRLRLRCEPWPTGERTGQRTGERFGQQCRCNPCACGRQLAVPCRSQLNARNSGISHGDVEHGRAL